jgi:hypothetical protein
MSNEVSLAEDLLAAMRDSSDPIGQALQPHRLRECVKRLGCADTEKAFNLLSEIPFTPNIGETTSIVFNPAREA